MRDKTGGLLMTSNELLALEDRDNVVDLGSGSQILGSFLAQCFVRAAGGSFLEPDPDQRGAVLKGSGVARGISLGR